jgi:NADH-quinone oxidoreductase subunit H
MIFFIIGFFLLPFIEIYKYLKYTLSKITLNIMTIYSANILVYLIMIILTIAFFTLLERKVMSSIQRRRGPNIVGLFGFIQPFADGLKLLLKELLYTSNSNILIFFLAPIFTFMCTLTIWLVIPLIPNYTLVDIPFSVLFLLAISSFSVHTIIFSGWASNSKYAFLGSIRSASQMISYEITISTIYLSVIMIAGSFSLSDIINSQQFIWFIWPLFPMWILFVITSLAETNRAPFDLPEAEAELVAGYNVEYSAITFALFFLAEYGNMILMSTLATIFFFGGWQFQNLTHELNIITFSIKIVCNMFIFLWVRAAYPRYRYDQLMKIGWKVLIPLSFSLLMFESSLLFTFHL